MIKLKRTESRYKLIESLFNHLINKKLMTEKEAKQIISNATMKRK